MGRPFRRERRLMRRGLTLAELLVALAVTTIVAAGVASLLSGVGAGIAAGADVRTGMLATAASHRRLHDLLDHVGCVLVSEDDVVLAWTGDSRPGGMVEATEAVWIGFDPDRGELVQETVEMPEDWGPLEVAQEDRPLAAGDAHLEILERYRRRDLVRRIVLVDGLTDAILTPAADGSSLRLDLIFELQAGSTATTTMVRFAAETPMEWR